MKRILLVVLLVISSTCAYAQATIGPRIAITQNKLSFSNDNVESSGLRTGYQFGIFLRSGIPGSQLSIQPEILYSQSELSFQLSGERYELDIDRFEVPLLFITEIGPLRLQAGPSFSIISDVSRTEPNGSVRFLRTSYENFAMGFQAGVGIDLKRLILDLRIGGDINEIGTMLSNGIEAGQRQRQIVLAIGYDIL